MAENPFSLDDLLKEAASDDPARRWVAVHQLADLRPPQAMGVLIHMMLHDPAESIASMAATTLMQIGDAQSEDAFIAALRHGDMGVRRTAIQALGRLKSGRAAGPLTQLLLTETELRDVICDALVKLGPAAASSLLPILTQDAPRIRRDAAEILGRIGNPQAFDPLMTYLTDRAPKVRAMAAIGLGAIGDTRALQPLIQLLSDPDRNVRKSIAAALGKLQDRRAIGPLMNQLADSDEKVRREVVKALAKIPDADTFRVLLPYLNDPSEKVVIEVMAALRRLDGGRAIEPLISMLSHTQFAIRESAATELGRIGEPALMPLVKAAYQAQGEGLWHTGSAIARITDPAVTPTHIQLLHHEIDRVSFAAYEALRKIGTPEALAAVEAWEHERRARGG